jgi:hypothetical protein
MHELPEARYVSCSHGDLRQQPLQPLSPSPRYDASSRLKDSSLLVMR